MDQEKKLEEELFGYQKLSRENKNVDVASLMINAMQNQQVNMVSPKMKKWAYLVSIGLPPFGLIFAVKLYLSSQRDAKHVANVCVVLTILGLLPLWLFGKMIFSSIGPNTAQIQHLNLHDIRELYQ